jgi:dihydroneopterin aldolase
MTIRLEQLRFYGYHGLYVHERKLGAWFELDVTLDWPDPDHLIEHLHETINYVVVYDLIKSRMQEPAELLETLAMEMTAQFKENFPQLTNVKIRVAKINPPLLNFQGTVAVEYHKSF